VSFISAILSGIRPVLPAPLIDFGLKQYLNGRYSSIGKISNLKVDAAARKVFMEIGLHGESEPLQVTIERYEVTEKEGRLFLEVLEFKASRAWVSALAPLLLKDRKFALPEFAKLAFVA
jgi:hypothetical protein